MNRRDERALMMVARSCRDADASSGHVSEDSFVAVARAVAAQELTEAEGRAALDLLGSAEAHDVDRVQIRRAVPFTSLNAEVTDEHR